MQTKRLVLAYVDAINAHDVDRIVDLSSDDHRFVDAYGDVTPAEQLRTAWSGYFKFMPEYAIQLEDVVCDGGIAALFGWAQGSLPPTSAGARSWRRPAAWRARVKGQKVQLWQVYVDTKIVFDLMSQPTSSK